MSRGRVLGVNGTRDQNPMLSGRQVDDRDIEGQVGPP